MISVGIFTGYYPYTLAETIERAKKDGMSCVQLDLEFKSPMFRPELWPSSVVILPA